METWCIRRRICRTGSLSTRERKTVTGTPTTVEAPTVTYTVRDEDQRRGRHDLYDRGQLLNNDADVG